MRIRMRYPVSGTRNGQPWPAPGGEIDLPGDEALILIKTQMADAVENRQEPEKATAPKVEETREKAPKKPAMRKPGRPRKTAPKVAER